MTEHRQGEGRADDPADQESPMEDVAQQQTIAQPAAEEPASAAAEGSIVSGPSVNLDDAEQQVAEWQREDQALLGEPPEVAPASAEGPAAPPASASEAEIAARREEAEALLGEGLEATPVPTAQELQG
jgi:hypothetical protein